MHRKVGLVAIVLILALCTTGMAYALPLSPDGSEAPGRAGLWGGMWNWLLDWLSQAAGGEGLSVWQTEGCHIDPNGHCLQQQ